VHRRACPPPVRCHNAEAELQCVCQRRDALCPARVLADHNSFPPVRYVHADPAGEEGLGDEVVDGALEEALHLGGVEVDGHDVVNAGNVEEVRNHAGRDGAAVLLLLGLARVREVGHDGRHRLGRAALAGRDHDQQLHDRVVDSGRLAIDAEQG
jgi:hypothetical protein